MTIDLNMMIDLRDLQVALDVAQRAKMGWFDVEFTMYGCAYWENGTRYYQVSSYDEKIYSFIENSAKNGYLPSDICTLTRKYPVPTGMRDYIAIDVKKTLAKEMAAKFPKEFFGNLGHLAVLATEETAMPLLKEQMQMVSGGFDLKKLKRFHEMVEYAYLNRKIGQSSYQELMIWINEERKSMEDNYISKDIFEKTFYAIAYEARDGWKYIINARKGYVYRKKYELEMKGIFVSSLFSDTYYYNYTLGLPQVRKMFEQDLKNDVTKEYMDTMKKIYKNNAMIPAEEFDVYLQETAEKYGESSMQTLRHYGYRWGILW